MGGASRLLAVAVLALGCSEEKRTRSHHDREDEPSAAPPQATLATSADVVELEQSYPIVEIEGSSLTVDGKPAGNVVAVLDAQRPERLDEVFAALKQRRERWKEERPGKPFPGLCGLRAADDAPLLVVKSVFQTVAFAGYPLITLQSTSDPKRFADLAAIVPGPPTPDPEGTAAPPEAVLHLRSDEVKTASWKVGATVVEEWKDPGSDGATFEQKICQSWAERGSHRPDDDPHRDEAVVHAPNEATLSAVWPLFDAIASCKRPGGSRAFFISFSIR